MTKPLPEQYGITQSEIDGFKLRRARFEHYMLGAIWVSVPFVAFLLVYRSAESVSATLSLFLVSILPLTALCMMFGLVMNAIFSSIGGVSSVGKAVERYETAVASYELHLKKIEDERRRMQQDYLRSLGGDEFEREVASLYTRLGYATSLTSGSGDGGIDIIMHKDGKTIIVQCKAHKKPAGPHVIRDLYGTLVNSKADAAILASLAGCTSGVREFIKDKPITLICEDDLIRMQKQCLSHDG